MKCPRCNSNMIKTNGITVCPKCGFRPKNENMSSGKLQSINDAQSSKIQNKESLND